MRSISILDIIKTPEQFEEMQEYVRRKNGEDHPFLKLTYERFRNGISIADVIKSAALQSGDKDRRN